jgi:hypothetical protein
MCRLTFNTFVCFLHWAISAQWDSFLSFFYSTCVDWPSTFLQAYVMCNRRFDWKIRKSAQTSYVNLRAKIIMIQGDISKIKILALWLFPIQLMSIDLQHIDMSRLAFMKKPKITKLGNPQINKFTIHFFCYEIFQ